MTSIIICLVIVIGKFANYLRLYIKDYKSYHTISWDFTHEERTRNNIRKEKDNPVASRNWSSVWHSRSAGSHNSINGLMKRITLCREKNLLHGGVLTNGSRSILWGRQSSYRSVAILIGEANAKRRHCHWLAYSL